MNVDTIKQTLDMNGNLSKDLKENIVELVNIFHNKFPEVDLTNLNKRLSNLQIKRLNKFLSNEVSMYDNVANILYFNNDRMQEECDAKHVLMYEIINIISSTDTQRGFIRDGKFEALNVGFTEILTNHLVGNEGEVIFHEEQSIETNLISIIIGSDVLKQAFFNNDTDLLIKGFADAGVSL